MGANSLNQPAEINRRLTDKLLEKCDFGPGVNLSIMDPIQILPETKPDYHYSLLDKRLIEIIDSTKPHYGRKAETFEVSPIIAEKKHPDHHFVTSTKGIVGIVAYETGHISGTELTNLQAQAEKDELGVDEFAYELIKIKLPHPLKLKGGLKKVIPGSVIGLLYLPEVFQ